MRHGLVELLFLALASFRLTHLIVFDKIMEPLRRPFIGRPFFGTLVTCYWCAGVWVSAILIAGAALWPKLFYWAVVILAVSGAQALIEWWLQLHKRTS